jgi:hypothetical protein
MASERETVERYIQAEADRDWDTLTAMRHADFTETWPQSAERIVGDGNWRNVHENYPGYPDIDVHSTQGPEPTTVVTPSFTLVKLTGAGDAWVVQGINNYPDGSVYHLVKLVDLRDGKVHAETTYFAERGEAPQWRAQWVERTSHEH